MTELPQEETAYTSPDNIAFVERNVIAQLRTPVRNMFPEDPDFAEYALQYWQTILAGEPRIRIPRLVSHLTCFAQMAEWKKLGCSVAEMRAHMQAHIDRCLVSHTPPDKGETYVTNMLQARTKKGKRNMNTALIPGSIPERKYAYDEPSPEIKAQWRKLLIALRDFYKPRGHFWLSPNERVALLSEVTPLGFDDTSLRIGCPNDRTAAFVAEYYANDLAKLSGKTVLIETGARQ